MKKKYLPDVVYLAYDISSCQKERELVGAYLSFTSAQYGLYEYLIENMSIQEWEDFAEDAGYA